AAGLSGHLFIWLTIKIKKISMSLKRIPLPVWLALGGLFTGASGMYAYGVSGYDSVFSIGYGVLPRAFAGDVALKGMFVIFAFKFLTTSANYALGGSGGIFSGALVIGGMLGGSIGALMCAAFGLDPSVIGACLLMGVGACIASIVRCPITSILMIFELTLNYSLILPILAGNCAAYFISRRLSPLGVYDSFLLAENVALKKLSAFNGRRDWAKIPVGAIATFHPSTLSGSQTAGLALKARSGAPQTFSAYPVLGDAREFIGTVRLEDIKRPENSDKKISEILRTGAADFIEPSKSISEAANIIIEKDALMLPLISNKNPERLIGIITLHDIARQQNASEKELF
ncbi:MAG: chloride channel protein, partial [Opitutales bacterium]|nr:chloride channel protein [Opitutales bacterium]